MRRYAKCFLQVLKSAYKMCWRSLVSLLLFYFTINLLICIIAEPCFLVHHIEKRKHYIQTRIQFMNVFKL
jgi:hypothetical protein